MVAEYRLEFYVPLFRYHSRWNELTKLDFDYELNGLKGGSIYSGYLKVSNDVSANYHNTDKRAEIDGRIEEALENLMDYCEAEKVNILFVTEPLAQHDEIVVAEYNTINAMINERGFPTLNMMDVMDDIGLDLKKDYYNNHHVNIHGSVKTTDYLSRYLIENYHIEDKRGDPAYSDWDEAYDKYVDIIAPFAVDFEYADTHRANTLPAPELTGVKVNGGNALTLTWKKVNGADGYGVYRQEDRSGWQRIADVGADILTYRDESCIPTHTYTYTVASYKVEDGEVYWGSYDFTGVAAIEVPPAPGTLQVSNGADCLSLSWEKEEGADGYQIYRRGALTRWTMIADINGTNYTDKDFLEGIPYQYRVRAYSLNEAGEKIAGLYSYCIWLPEMTGPEVTAELVDGVPTLTWPEMVGMTNYTVTRRTDGGDWGQIAEPLAADCVQFRDITATAGESYEYQVTANIIYAKQTYTYPSDAVQVTAEAGLTALEAPELLFCEQVGNTVQLVWEPSANATAYRIYRMAEGEDTWTVVNASIGGNTYQERPPAAGTYTYVLQPLRTESGCVYYGTFDENAAVTAAYGVG